MTKISIMVIKLLTFCFFPSLMAANQSTLIPLDGGALLPLTADVKPWKDRGYTLNKLPEAFNDHPVFIQASIQHGARFKTSASGYVVVLTPVSEDYNQSARLLAEGFEYVDIEPFNPYSIRPNQLGQQCIALQKNVEADEVISFGRYGIALWGSKPLPVRSSSPAERISIPTLDISGELNRHVVVAAGTEETYQGHVDTLLMPDGKTMFAAWAINHAGHLGPLARSDDAGMTWNMVETPSSWREVRHTTPTIHRLTDPNGVERLFVFGGQDFPGRLRQSYSEDGGKTWTPMQDIGLNAECAPKSILPFDDGKRLVMWCDRRNPESGEDPVIFMSESFDGGLTWSPERVILNVPTQWAQPTVIRSSDDNDRRAVMLMRYNGGGRSPLAVSDDDGETWSEVREASWNYTGHRPAIAHTADGRVVVVLRDTVGGSPSHNHFVAWVGTFDDLYHGRDGQYRVKLMHSHAGWDNAYSGLEVLPDGTVVGTNYLKYEPGLKKHSVVSTRFKLEELDAMLGQ